MSDNKHFTSRNFPQRKKSKTAGDINSMPEELRCPCGGGQSCIIDRRWVGDYVHEDDVFNRYGIVLRTSCITPYTFEQEKALSDELCGGTQSTTRRTTRNSNKGVPRNLTYSDEGEYQEQSQQEFQQRSITSRWAADAEDDSGRL